jgi:hypothetical protein
LPLWTAQCWQLQKCLLLLLLLLVLLLVGCSECAGFAGCRSWGSAGAGMM